MYDLQTRWRTEDKRLRYYGLRNQPNTLKNTLRINKKQIKIISQLPRELLPREIRTLGILIGTAIVKSGEKRTVPRSIDEARFCTGCIANDFMIPGLEFDASGRCPICQSDDAVRGLRSVVPVKNTFERSKSSRFDVALFYTGGKDSTYLLYYLSRVQGLRVLALTWEIPYMSDSAKKSIERAKERFDTVEFIVTQRLLYGEELILRM